jgi:3D-(3,5/4)-trihydroxycyclohexane-1,2-dione acylhydrolase (decyclizing)
MALPIVGDALLSLINLSQELGGHRFAESWTRLAKSECESWDRYVDDNISPTSPEGSNRPMSYAQVIGAINTICHPRDRVVAAAGGLPAEVAANWRTLEVGTVDIEFGYSCMGYEIAGGWGARIAQMETEPERDTIIFTGDGSYLMMNSDIYSSVLNGRKLIIVVCDNGGFAVINKLQNNTGNVSFNNLIADCNIETESFAVDFSAHARAMGASAEDVHSIDELKLAFARAQKSKKTYVICLKVDAYEGWTKEGHTWWEIGTPSISNRREVLEAHDDVERGRSRQRAGV